MGYFYDEAENLTIDEKVACLDDVLSRLCGRIDSFELKIDELGKSIARLEELIKTHVSGSSQENVDTSVIAPESVEEEDCKHDVIGIMYCGLPDGSGFDVTNCTKEIGIRSLYVIGFLDENHAIFYPVEEKLSRFRNNASSLLCPVCDINGDITECDSIKVSKEGYGKLENEEGSYWAVKEKCIVDCIVNEEK